MDGVAPRAEQQAVPPSTPETWFHVRGVSTKLAADIDALEASARHVQTTDTLIQDAMAQFNAADHLLTDDWNYLCFDARRYAEQRAELDGVELVQRPTWDEQRQFSVRLADIEELRTQAIALAPRLRELGAVAFQAAVEYQRAERQAKNYTRFIEGPFFRRPRLSLFDSVLWGAIEIAVRSKIHGDEMHPYERMQSGLLLADADNRRSLAFGAAALARPVARGLADDKGITYSSEEKDLIVSEIEPQDVSSVDSSIASLRDVKAENNSAIQITKAMRDGKPVYTINIPGTVSWSPTGWEHPIDITSNVVSMYGGQSTGMTYVEEAMKRAGVEPGADIVMMGHSQGGIIASALASKTAFTHRYNVRGLVTMNSPTANNNVKAGIPTLHLEHWKDPVSALDNTSMPVSRDRMQVVGTVDQSDGIGDHDVETSRRLLRNAMSESPEVREMVDRIEEWLPSRDEVTESKTYDVNRTVPADREIKTD